MCTRETTADEWNNLNLCPGHCGSIRANAFRLWPERRLKGPDPVKESHAKGNLGPRLGDPSVHRSRRRFSLPGLAPALDPGTDTASSRCLMVHIAARNADSTWRQLMLNLHSNVQLLC